MRVFQEVYRSVAERKEELGHEKTEGIHLYINVDNLDELVSNEEDNDEDIKRTIHMLNTFFDGITYIVKEYEGCLEKLTKGRSHFYFEYNNEEDNFDEEKERVVKRAISSVIAIFNYNYNIFNNLGKYSGYDNFKISAGIDAGEFYKYTIELTDEETEFTTIGSVANVAAKIQSAAHGKQMIFTNSLYDLIDEEFKEDISPVEVDGDQLSLIKEKTRLDETFYKVDYSTSLNTAVSNMETIIENVEERSKKKANEVNIRDMKYTKLYSKLKFSNLGIRNNKKLEGVILYSDIRGFTKLFMNDDSNLDDLFVVMQSIYQVFQDVVDDFNGTRVQFQGDRLVAVFNDFNGEDEESYIRSLRAAAEINTQIKELNKLGLIDKDIAVGTGISFGAMIATRTGMNRNKDNLVLSEVTSNGNKAEDKYAEGDFDIVVHKSIKEEWEECDSAWCTVFIDLFDSIDSTGFYRTEDLDTETLQEKYDEEMSNQEKALYKYTNSGRGARSDKGLKPWGKPQQIM